MDTEAQHTERDPSSDTDSSGTEEGSRSARVSGDSGRVPGDSGRESDDAGHEPDDSARDSEDSERTPSWRRTALVGGACVVFLLLLSHFVIQPFLIPSGSMEPTLQVGDRILVNKLAYRFGSEPARGDVVVFDGTGSFVGEQPKGNPVTGLLHDGAAALGLAEPDETDFVKRVVGVGGDRVVCCDKDGRLTVNGVPVQERYVMLGDRPSSVPFDIVVPQDRLWVMGDHRSQSSDSRDHLGNPGGGMVPVDKVVGRADWIAWPFGRWSTVPGTDAFDAVPAPPAGGHGVGAHG
ncbi:signal peptidase I [Streptomyces vietnamensis]|uniref:Signal peptidase I n=1 Tax=Streptomyces vietnamensis TaxID=362257 RepID=A0A0B5ICW5_9ACTN|nr:signal peptidase I [Streptomyces vietnamensis]AJF67518.1 peptidase S26 [Streptomyces vietnamensis]